MGRISRKDKVERFDDEMIKLAISLDKQSKTSKYLLALLDAYEEKEVNVEDSVVAFALESQQERIKAYVEQQKALHEKRSKAGTIGMQKRWNEQNWQTNSKTFAKDVSPYPFEEFWNAYNYIKNQKGTSEIWRMMPDEDRKAAIEAVPKYLKWYENEKKRNPKHTKLYPKTFLLDKRFLDDFTIEEVTNTQTASNYGSNNGKSYKEAEFERNARTIVENLQAADRGELAYLSPFNKSGGEHQPF